MGRFVYDGKEEKIARVHAAQRISSPCCLLCRCLGTRRCQKHGSTALLQPTNFFGPTFPKRISRLPRNASSSSNFDEFNRATPAPRKCCERKDFLTPRAHAQQLCKEPVLGIYAGTLMFCVVLPKCALDIGTRQNDERPYSKRHAKNDKGRTKRNQRDNCSRLRKTVPTDSAHLKCTEQYDQMGRENYCETDIDGKNLRQPLCVP